MIPFYAALLPFFPMDWKFAGSFMAALMFFQSLPRLIHPDLYALLRNLFFKYVFRNLNPIISINIQQHNSSSLTNDMYESARYYLSSKTISSAHKLHLFKSINSNQCTYTLADGQTIEDRFQGINITWSPGTLESTGRIERIPYLNLTFHSKHRQLVQSLYIPHIIEEASIIRFNTREKHLYTNRKDYGGGPLWTSVPFSHPSTFETLAIDPVLKEEIKGDLSMFVKKKDYYKRVGKSWKRGYLLYGPPGTGKTSLIAAIANFLRYDVYDLELMAVDSNLQLRKLLMSTSSRSLIVVEDIDCTLDLSDRNRGTKDKEEEIEGKGVSWKPKQVKEKLSLSGVLNFVDGLWSSCGEERMMVFTTNHKENLDPALLRPGRMDKQIHLSYCQFMAFKTLVKNYLDIDNHDFMNGVEEILPNIQMTPAEIAEVFMGFGDDPDLAMRKVVEEMKKRKTETTTF